MSKYLFIISELPFTNHATEETLELAIGFATVNSDINVLFLDAACLQLKDNLSPNLTGFSQKSIGIIDSLSSYNINCIYIMQEDLDRFKLNISDLRIKHAVISKSKLNALYVEHDIILHSSARK